MLVPNGQGHYYNYIILIVVALIEDNSFFNIKTYLYNFHNNCQ